MDVDIAKPKLGSLSMQSLKLVVSELSDEDKLSLLESIYKPKDEPDISNMDLDFLLENITVGQILLIIRNIDMQCRTNFSARIYFSGDHYINDRFDRKASYNEIGVIANCKLVGQVLLRLVRHFYVYPDEEDIEELLQHDKETFKDNAENYGGFSINGFIKFLAYIESTFLSDYIITSEFTTEIYSRGIGRTTTYETDISKVDVWTIARLYSELYGEQIYERKVISVTPLK